MFDPGTYTRSVRHGTADKVESRRGSRGFEGVRTPMLAATDDF